MQKNKISSKLMNVLIILCILLSSLSFVFSADDDMNNYEYLKLKIDNDINFNLKFEPDYDIKNFEVTSYFLPQTFNGTQYLNSFETNHQNYYILNGSEIYSLKYVFNKNDLKTKNTIENTFIVESTKHQPRIYKKIKYPLTDIPKEYQEYLSFKDLIDIDDDIRTQASNLASGEDDTYIIASKIAKWIREDVTYDLSTVTENPNQKSTQVFKSKTGVCKEISNLYISMMRALGIPARVITGYAYTNSEEIINYVGSPWGGHAWVEVLIGENWVPFDLTYNQYGFVDATHIILDKSANIRSNSLYLNSTGYGYKFDGQATVDTDFTVLNKASKIKKEENGYDMTIEGPSEIGFGSYGYLKIKIKNKDNFYKILFLSLSKIAEVENLDSPQKMIIFKPNEEKEVYFRYKITDDLKPNYQYTFPFTVYNDFFEQQYSVVVKEDYLTIKEIALPKEEEISAELSDNNLAFNCNYMLSNPSNIILCSIKNPNNYEINNIQICIQDNCQRLDLKLNEQKTISFETSNINETINYKYDNKQFSKTLQIEMPKLVYNTQGVDNGVYFNYNIENYVEGTSLIFYVNNHKFSTYKKENQNILIPLNSTNNTIKIQMLYEDRLLSEEEIDVVANITKQNNSKESFWQRLIRFFKSLF